MDSMYIVTKVNEYLHVATGSLSDWLMSLLPKATEHWWDECVMDKLSFNQREMAKNKAFTKLADFDLAALLRIADKNWYTMRNFAYLPTSERECVRAMQSVRNNWAHCGRALPPKEAIIYDIEIIQQFLEQLSVSKDHITGLLRFKNEVETGILFNQFHSAGSEANNVDSTENGTDEISERSMVYLVGDPSTRGMVFSVETIGTEKKYDVFVNGALRTFYSGQIALIDDTPKYHWVDASTLQSYLSAYQINNPSSGNLYSLNSARIDFVPYQFRPALKLVKADEPRILIADSVGVGKTIEAGLIIKELEARGELENVMIVCPKPLVSERKWELEMKRFDEEFIPLNGPQLRQIISDTDRDGEWPSRFNRTIVPYSILDSRIYDGDDSKKSHCYGLSSLDPAPHFDLVIIDEAHHIRNGSLDKEKAYAYKCVKYFCDHADAVVMLTATPLQTGDDDLFTLLNVLRPDIVLDKATFRLMSEPNAYISRCAHIVRAAEDGWQAAATEELENLQTTRWGDNVIAQNPVYGSVLEKLGKKNLTREDRVQLITDIESLHSFNTMLNRTRRKDIQDFCVRRSHTLETSFTAEQRNLHNELLQFERSALSVLHNNPRSVPFMMSTIRRQAASCIFGLAPHIRDIINRRFAQMVDDPEFDIDTDCIHDADATALVSLAERVLFLADNLPEEDPKFDSVCEIVKQKQSSDNNKIILFSTFRHTLAYLKKKFQIAGLRVEQIDGSVKDETRCALRERFMLPKADPNAIDMLLFTEVGSEGLDYQFCDMMINYDLPWNPMRIEQRIGRIDRRGQHSEVVNIYNVITGDTVDADIYYRCLNRIGVFERSIGECEEILGEIGTKVEQIAFNSTLTDAERRAKLEQMADNEIRKLQELSRLEDEEKGLFGFDLSSYTVSKEIQEAESPWLTPKSIQLLVERYLSKRLGGDNFIIGEGNIKTLRLSQPNRLILREDLRNLPDNRTEQKRRWDVFLKGKKPMQKITFDSDAAEKDRSALFITTVHPLVKQAAKYFATNEPAHICLQHSDDSITPGTYAFSVYAWNYIGINPHFKLVAVCEQDEIAADFANILQFARTAEFAGKPPIDKWKVLEAKHFTMWQEEKRVHSIAAHSVASYKIESIESSFSNRKRVLNEQIQSAYDEKIIRMRQAELENATERHQAKIEMLNNQEQQADIHITLIANGIITIQ